MPSGDQANDVADVGEHTHIHEQVLDASRLPPQQACSSGVVSVRTKTM
ncbi:MAG TPA: hypothetical protein VGL99_23870 [Chloroflexota bacterium]